MALLPSQYNTAGTFPCILLDEQLNLRLGFVCLTVEGTHWPLTVKVISTLALKTKCAAQAGLTGEKEDHNDRVDNGEPVDLHVAHGEVGVPSRCPLHRALLRGMRRSALDAKSG